MYDEKAETEDLLPQYSNVALDSNAGLELRSKRRQRLRTAGKKAFPLAFALLGLTFIFLFTQQPACLTGMLGHSESANAASSRRNTIETGSQALSGDFNLYDLLAFRSQSGSLDLNVRPQSADESSPAPAELSIRTLSGSVAVSMPADDIPDRDYRVTIHTLSGSVSATLPHGRRTDIATGSALLKLHLTPVSFDGEKSTVRTATASGSQDVTVYDLLNGKLDKMDSVHRSASGSMALHYPAGWQGLIEGRTLSGSIKLHGTDLEGVESEDSPAGGHYVRATRGTGNSTLRFHGGSGSVDVYFG